MGNLVGSVYRAKHTGIGGCVGKMGYGYGSEWQLTRFLGRHRAYFTRLVSAACNVDSIEWLDFSFKPGDWLGDGELLGLEFLPDRQVREYFRDWWPRGSGIMNWDAIGFGEGVAGRQSWVLVEAKGNLRELRSSCGASPASLKTIEAALAETRAACGVVDSGAWTVDYYQHANRLAVLHFLRGQGVEADLVDVYFTGSAESDSRSPSDEASWEPAIAEMKRHLGLLGDSALEPRAHEVFVGIQG